MELKLFNTLTRKKEVFKSIHKDYVGMYSCGPTVYWYQHIGNLRTYIFSDILKRVLEYNGYKVKHVMNITDVGHLTSDADTGEDKMEKAAAKEGRKQKK
jgi:cysteinyl-tRNA synthetase